MIKTIKTKKRMKFRELMEYIIQNDISGDFKSVDGKYRFKVKNDGKFLFDEYLYGLNETYEVEVEEEITEDMGFDRLVEIHDQYETFTHHYATIRKIKDSGTEKIYALIDGELQLVWQRGEENV